MTEQDIERRIDLLEQRWDNRMLSTAIAAIEKWERTFGDPETGEEPRGEAHDAVAKLLLDSTDWEKVEATVISDIAYEVAERAWSQTQTWKQA